MTFVLSILFVIAFVFACVCLHLSARLDDANGRITLLEIKANYSEQSEKTLRESVGLQTKCIRDLNDIVKKSVENKEPIEPDTKALLGGWIVEEPELPKEQSRQIDSFRVQKLISSLHCENIPSLYYQLCLRSELNEVLGALRNQRGENE